MVSTLKSPNKYNQRVYKVKNILNNDLENVIKTDYSLSKQLVSLNKNSRNNIKVELEETDVEGRPKPIRTVVNKVIRDNPTLVNNSANIKNK